METLQICWTALGPERKLSVSLKFRSTVLKLLRLEPCLLQQALLKSYFSRNVFNLDYTLYLYSFLWISNSSRVNWWMSGVYVVIQEPKQTTNVFRRALAHWAQVLPVLPYRKKTHTASPVPAEKNCHTGRMKERWGEVNNLRVLHVWSWGILCLFQ